LKAVGQSGAFVDHGSAMDHQLLEQAGLAVLGAPGLELVWVVEQQLGQVLGILAIVLGAAGDEGLAVFLQGDGVDGVESDPLITFQEGDEMAGGLFQAELEPELGLALVQVQEPVPKNLRGALQGLAAGLAGGGVDEVKVHFAVGAIQTDDPARGGIGIRHSMALQLNGCMVASRRLDLATAI
jgi:hypothetical protein